jgi:hypothetical protein
LRRCRRIAAHRHATGIADTSGVRVFASAGPKSYPPKSEPPCVGRSFVLPCVATRREIAARILSLAPTAA